MPISEIISTHCRQIVWRNKPLHVLKGNGRAVDSLFFPDSLHGDEMLSLIIGAESAAAFDLLTRSSADDEMVQQNKDRWPNTFRASRFVPAVEYINACRLRYQIMKKMDPLIDSYDVIITPPETGDQLPLPTSQVIHQLPCPMVFCQMECRQVLALSENILRSYFTGFCESIPGAYRLSFKTSARLHEMSTHFRSIFFLLSKLLERERKYFPRTIFLN